MMFLKRIFILLIIILSCSNEVRAQALASYGVTNYTFLNFTNATGNGTAFAIPQTSLAYITYCTSFGSAPASITFNMQVSLDKSTYSTVDTSTSTAGECRNFFTSAKFIRGNISAISGGTTTTVSFNIQKVNNTSSGAGTTFVQSVNKVLAQDGSYTAPSFAFASNNTVGLYNDGGITAAQNMRASTYGLLGTGNTYGNAGMYLSGAANDLNIFQNGGVFLVTDSANGQVKVCSAGNCSLQLGPTTAQQTAGYINFPTGKGIAWRNNANNADYTFRLVGAADELTTTAPILAVANIRFTGHIVSNGTTPTITACGTGAIDTDSTDQWGEVTATGATACTVNFATAWGTQAFCIIEDETTAIAQRISAISTTAFTVTGLTSGDKFMYHCGGK